MLKSMWTSVGVEISVEIGVGIGVEIDVEIFGEIGRCWNRCSKRFDSAPSKEAIRVVESSVFWRRDENAMECCDGTEKVMCCVLTQCWSLAVIGTSERVLLVTMVRWSALMMRSMSLCSDYVTLVACCNRKVRSQQAIACCWCWP